MFFYFTHFLNFDDFLYFDEHSIPIDCCQIDFIAIGQRTYSTYHTFIFTLAISGLPHLPSLSTLLYDLIYLLLFHEIAPIIHCQSYSQLKRMMVAFCPNSPKISWNQYLFFAHSIEELLLMA